MPPKRKSANHINSSVIIFVYISNNFVRIIFYCGEIFIATTMSINDRNDDMVSVLELSLIHILEMLLDLAKIEERG